MSRKLENQEPDNGQRMISSSANDHSPLIERAFSFTPEESSYEIGDIRGDVPNFLRGRYFLNGPARFARGDQPYRHWLDGDGMVCSLRFEESRVRYTNRFVRTRKWNSEEAEGRFLYRTFGTAVESNRLNSRGIGLESPANVSVYTFDGKLLAFGEQGLPWELDPETLETGAELTFNDRLNEVSPFSAHPKIDPSSGELFNFGVSFSGMRPSLAVYRFGPDSELLLRKRHPLDFPCSMHDFGLSSTYTCFVISPYVLEMSRLLDGGTLIDSLSWNPEEGTRLMIAARESGGQRTSLPIGSGYCLHFINCWETEDRLFVDILELDQPIYDQYQVLPDLFTSVHRGRPVRLEVDTDSWELIGRRELSYDLAPDFPSVDPRRQTLPYDDFWMLGISTTGQPGRKFFDQLVHCRWSDDALGDIYQAPPLNYLGGEPVFMPDPDGEGGVVICQNFNAEERESSFLLFDAGNVRQGPIARLTLRSPIPLQFHASYLEDSS